MFEIIYYSRGGNTKKVAEAIADELGTEAKEISLVNVVPKDAFIFLGSGCYGARMVKEIADFIERNGLKGSKIALFTTSAFGLGKEESLIKQHILDKGINIVGNFSCFGQFLAIKRGHPDSSELQQAREFARSIILSQHFQSSAIRSFPGVAGAAD